MGIKVLVLAAAGLASVSGCTPDPEATAPAAAPASAASSTPARAANSTTIVAARGGFIPEGIEYDQANQRFLTGSIAEGSVFAIGRDGSVTAVVTDPQLVSTVGIEVDEPRDRILVANSDAKVFQPGNVGHAKLGVYSLTTGARIAMVDLGAEVDKPTDPPAYFANDVTVDNDGNVYVTDTRQNVVYVVDDEYDASVLHAFTSMGEDALNGIVYHPAGFLLVVAGAKLFKVPVEDPKATTPVNVTEPIPGGDGMVWAADGRLVITSNIADNPRVVALRSNDNWASAQTVGFAPLTGQATTAAAVGDDIYVVHPHFADAEPPSIELATFQ